MISNIYVDCWYKMSWTFSVCLLSFRGCGTPSGFFFSVLFFLRSHLRLGWDPLGRLDYVSQWSARTLGTKRYRRGGGLCLGQMCICERLVGRRCGGFFVQDRALLCVFKVRLIHNLHLNLCGDDWSNLTNKKPWVSSLALTPTPSARRFFGQAFLQATLCRRHFGRSLGSAEMSYGTPWPGGLEPQLETNP